jgi:hypothetical protein
MDRPIPLKHKVIGCGLNILEELTDVPDAAGRTQTPLESVREQGLETELDVRGALEDLPQPR